MKILVVNRNLIVSIFTVILLVYGLQGISYGRWETYPVTPGETNTSLVVKFRITLYKGIRAYQIQLRQKSPQGEWISKCVVIEYGKGKVADDPDVSASRVWIPGPSGWFTSVGYLSPGNFDIKASFVNLDPGTTYEARYRDTNVSECTEDPPDADPWSLTREGTTHLVAPPRAELVDANLAKGVRNALYLDTEGGHIDLLKIPRKSLAKLTRLNIKHAGITDLTGLEQVTQLTELSLSYNQISDITLLAQLTQLTELNLEGNEITDPTPLAQLTQLTELNLEGNEITDPTPLAQLTQLTELNLEGNEITDLTPLAQLTQLNSLLLRDNPIGYLITDTSSLVRLLRENPTLDISIDIPIFMIAPSEGPDLYLINDDSIQRMSLVNTNFQDIVTGLDSPGGIALDVADGKIYWTESWDDKIQRANLDGTNIEYIVTGLDRPEGIALDVADGKIYWINGRTDKIQRANLDGTNIEDIVTGLDSPGGIALDVADGKIYWTELWDGKIQRANLDGTNIEDIVTGMVSPGRIAIDVADGKIYWSALGNWRDQRPYKIQRANLDGTHFEDIIYGLDSPDGIALDVVDGKIYWTERKVWEEYSDEEWSTYKIQRANLDGTNVQSIVVGLTNLRDIALSSSIVRDIPDSDSRTIFESSVLSGYTRVTLSDEGIIFGGPSKHTIYSDSGTLAFILLSQLKGCNFARAELARQSKVYIKTQALGQLRNFASRTKCSVTSRKSSFLWDGARITHIRYYDENSSPNIQEAIYNVNTGQYELSSITYGIIPVVSISPTSGTSPAIGEQITLNLNITGGEAVAGYQATMQFDDTALRYVSAANGDYLPAAAFFVEPKVEGNLIKLNAASLAGESNGDGPLATLTFEVIAAKASTLTLSDVLLTNSAGETFVPRIENGEITEPIGLKEDVNGDGTINVIADLVLVAGALGETGQNIADVNGDGQVNIAKISSWLLAHWVQVLPHPLCISNPLICSQLADVKQWLSTAQPTKPEFETKLKC